MNEAAGGHSTSYPAFSLPFGGHLDPENRWVRFAKIIPWDEVDGCYRRSLRDNDGTDAVPSRMAFCACFVKRFYRFSDAEVPVWISENLYVQYFAGYTEFSTEKPFDPSMMERFRERFPAEFLAKIDAVIKTGRWPGDGETEQS